MSELLAAARDERLLRLTLNRPAKRNALNSELCHALVHALDRAENDPETGAILIDAAGPTFCAGMDLVEALAPDAAEQTAIHERLFTAGARARKPIVMAVQGAALAGGTGLVANAHIAIAAEDATFGLTEIRIAMWPYVVFRAMKLAIGERRTLELSLTGRVFGAAEALQHGLVHRVVPSTGLAHAALEVARTLSRASASTIARGLEYVQRSRELSWDESGELAHQLRALNFQSADFTSAVRAFRQKRS